MRDRRLVTCLLGMALLGGVSPLASCSERKNDGTQPVGEATLPELRFDDATPNLMLTWIDGRGGTHVELRPPDVPEAARTLVRVVVADRIEGTQDPIYVVDLTRREGDGGYLARAMPRRTWEDEIAKRRDASPVTVADAPRKPHAPPPRPPGSNLPDPFAPPEPKPTSAPLGDAIAGVTVIVYGASWCKPCHEALDHLKERGVPAQFKDIEADRGAQSEMQAKLDKVGRRTGSIPVIDVGGQILVGYSRGALDKALRKAAGGTML